MWSTSLVVCLLLVSSTRCADPPPRTVPLYKCCPRGYAVEDEGFACLQYNPLQSEPWMPPEALKELPQDVRTTEVIPKLPRATPSMDPHEPCPLTVLGEDLLIPLESDEASLRVHVPSSGPAELHVLNSTTGELMHNETEWCVDVAVNYDGERTGTRLLTCPCIRRACVSLCCNEHQLIDLSLITAQSLLRWCVPDPGSSWGTWNLTDKLTGNHLDQFHFKTYDIAEYTGSCHAQSLVTMVGTATFTRLYPRLLESSFSIRKDGTLITDKDERDRGQYCLGESIVRGHRTTVAFYCKPDDFVVTHDQALVQSLSAAVGALFTVLTLVVHALSPSLRRGIKGISLMWHCACMLLAYLCLACRPLTWNSTSQDDSNISGCIALGIVTQFALLAAFFWLNVRAIIIHATFRSLDSMLSGLHGRSTAWFALYALGVPALIAGLTAWAQMSEEILPSWVIPPNIDATNCWFMTPEGRAVYFSAPMGVLLLVNGVLFVITARHLMFARKQARALRVGHADSLYSDFKRFKLYAKLFILMGLTWSAELFSWVNYLYKYYWHTSNVAIVLRAIFVFVIFCCSRKVWRELSARYPRVLSCCGMRPHVAAVFYTRHLEDSSTSKTAETSARSPIVKNLPLREQRIEETEEDQTGMVTHEKLTFNFEENQEPIRGIPRRSAERPSLTKLPEVRASSAERQSFERHLSESRPALYTLHVCEGPGTRENTPESRGGDARPSSPSLSSPLGGGEEALEDVALTDEPHTSRLSAGRPRGIRALVAGYNQGQVRLSRFLSHLRGSLQQTPS